MTSLRRRKPYPASAQAEEEEEEEEEVRGGDADKGRMPYLASAQVQQEKKKTFLASLKRGEGRQGEDEDEDEEEEESEEEEEEGEEEKEEEEEGGGGGGNEEIQEVKASQISPLDEEEDRKKKKKHHLQIKHQSDNPSSSYLNNAPDERSAHQSQASSIIVNDNDNYDDVKDTFSITKSSAKPHVSSTRKIKKNSKKIRHSSKWKCLDTCCWLIGYICCVWWVLLVLYKALPSLSEAISGPHSDPPGAILKKEGLKSLHPVVFVPGIVTGGLELWEGHPCAEELFRKRLWGGTFGDVYKRPFCWLKHMALDNITGLDPEGLKVRPVSGLVAADYFIGGFFVWAILIQNLAKIGYEEKNLHMAAYDWRLSFQNTEYRDKTLSRLKSTIELLVQTNGGNKIVAVPHSMGTLYFMHFMKWVEAPLPMGGGGGPDWCAKHIKSVMNIAGPLLGVPKALSGIFSAEAKDIAVARAIAPGLMDSEALGIQTLQHIMHMARSWDSVMSMIPKGGEVIWGGMDWSPEDGFECHTPKQSGGSNVRKRHDSTRNRKKVNETRYGRLISFGNNVAEISKPFKPVRSGMPIRVNYSCGDPWTEYHEMSLENIHDVAEHEVFTADTVPDLLRYVAPAMMQRGEAQFSHGLAEDLDDPKYQHFKYWSNPLETRLPNAPDMEVYCMYGVGLMTERAYVYKLSPHLETCHIPFRIDTTINGDSDEDTCLKGGTRFVDGDETVPVLSAGFMCAKGWRGNTRFNPSGSATFVREYEHDPPSNLLEGRGTQSSSHVDIMGNFALIEDIMRVAAGASGEEIGGDRIYSDILKWADRIPLKL